MMMQGRLQANIEDELKKDLVPPEFMVSRLRTQSAAVLNKVNS